MKWSDSIALGQPLRDVRLLVRAPAQDWAAHLLEREREAYDRGFRDGEKSLGEQLLAQRKEMAEHQKGVVDALQRAIPQVIQEAEKAMVHLALESARKIVAGMPVTLEMTENIVREALRQVEGDAEVLVQLHPEDLALVRKHESPLLKDTTGNGSLRFVGSSDVTRGGCIVQTRFGLIDARRETKFEQLREALAI
jgi:flagellar assembly protein FliH